MNKHSASVKGLQWLLGGLLISASSFAQDYPGFRTGNYTGVHGVFSNPANIAGNPRKWDVNLISVNTSLGNNAAEFSLKDIATSFNGDSIKNQLFGNNAGPTSGLFNLNLVGPSVMFRTGKKMSFALTSRVRAMVNIKDIDGQLARQIIDSDQDDFSFPYTIASNNNMSVGVNGWTEFGASVARVLYSEGKHYVKGGVSLKYLAGASNAYLHIDKLNGTLNEGAGVQSNVYLHNASGGIGVGMGGVVLSEDFEIDELMSFKSSGIGADIGFVYEYRPENQYKFRVGVSVLDIGSLKYKKDMSRSGSYNIDIQGAERFYLDELEGVELSDYKGFLDSRPQYFTPAAGNTETDIKVSLPTTLQVDFDYHVAGGFYTSLAGQFALSKAENKPYNTQYYNGFTLAPRFETKAFGVYVPLNYNELTKFNAGVSLRMGPLFIGSGSVLTALASKSKQADVHIGIRFGG